MRTGLFFIALIALSTVYSMNTDVQFFSELKNTEFGKTLLETIQVELKSNSGNDAVAAVLKLLQDLSSSLSAEGAADAKSQDGTLARLNGNVVALTKAIAFQSAALRRDRNQVKQNNVDAVSAGKLLGAQTTAITQSREALSQNAALQAQATQQYRYFFTQLAAQITGLAEARAVLVTLQTRALVQTDASSFIQMSNTLTNIKFQHPKFQGFINILAQMMSNTEQIVADQRLVKRIVHLVDRLYGMLVKESSFLTFSHGVVISDLQVIAANIEIAIGIAESAIASLETRVARLNSASNAAQSRIATNVQRRSESRVELADRNTQVTSAVIAYRLRVSKRAQELGIVARALSVFKNSFTAAVRQSLSAL